MRDDPYATPEKVVPKSIEILSLPSSCAATGGEYAMGTAGAEFRYCIDKGLLGKYAGCTLLAMGAGEPKLRERICPRGYEVG